MKEYMRVKGRRGVYNEYVVCECECEKAEGDTECKEEQRIRLLRAGVRTQVCLVVSGLRFENGRVWSA